MAATVEGQVGAARYKVFLASVLTLSCLTIVMVASLPFLRKGPVQEHIVIIGGSLAVALWILVLYNIRADGPRRCCDISAPIFFSLSEDYLMVSLAGTRWKRYRAGDIVAVHVYMRSFEYGFGRRRRSQGAPVPIENRVEIGDGFGNLKSCMRMLFGSGQQCKCVFLGAELAGHEGPIPLSRYLWHERGGLEELFELQTAVQRFQDRRFQVIAALPTWQIPEHDGSDLEAQRGEEEREEVECSICLGTMTAGDTVCELPCRHMLHQSCAEQWLRLKAVCPMCKEPIDSTPKPRAPRTANCRRGSGGRAWGIFGQRSVVSL